MASLPSLEAAAGPQSMATLFPGCSPADVYSFLLKQYNYNDSGAFAEIHVPQFPNGVGLRGVAAAAAPVAFSAGFGGSGVLMLTGGTSSAASAGAEPKPTGDQTEAAPSKAVPSNPYAVAVIPDASNMSAGEEQSLRAAQGGLLFVHTPESALATKTFTAEELRKPSDEAIAEGLARTQAAIEAVLADQLGSSAAEASAASSSGNAQRVRQSGGGAANPFLPNALASKELAKQRVGADAAASSAPAAPAGDASHASRSLTIVVPTAAAHYTNAKNTNAVASAHRSDPAPVLRSPTKRQAVQHAAAMADGAVFGGVSGAAAASSSSASAASLGIGLAGGIPVVVNNYKNKKGVIFSLAQRAAAQGPTATTDVAPLNERHFAVARALGAAQRTHEASAEANQKARGEAERRLQQRGEEEAAQKAIAVLERRAAEAAAEKAAANANAGGEGDTAMPHQPQQPRAGRETREQYAARIAAERRAKDEERDEERRQKRLARTAERLGITVAELEGDAGLMAATGEGGAGGADEDLSAVFDPRVLAMANSAASMKGTDISALLSEGGAPDGHASGAAAVGTTSSSAASEGYAAAVAFRGGGTAHLHSAARMADEMRRLEALDAARASAPKRAAAVASDSSDDDDSDGGDVFGLAKKHHRRE